MQASKEVERQQRSKVGEAKVSFLRGKLPRAYAWIRTADGRAKRVTILFDSGASHCFMSPRVQQALGLKVNQSSGPAVLLTSNEQQVPCEGEVGNLQVLAHQYKSRMSFVVADIGRDDIIIGGEVLEMQEGGFGPAGSGLYKMKVNGKEFMIPLIGEHAPPEAVETVRGTKKAVKLMLKYGEMVYAGRIWRKNETSVTSASAKLAEAEDEKQEETEDGKREETEDGKMEATKSLPAEKQTVTSGESSADAQDEDAQRFKEGGTERIASVTSVKEGSSTTASSLKVKQARRRQRTQEIVRRIEKDKQEMQATSEKVKADLLEEFPDVFTEPRVCPPLRWENHRMEILPGAKIPTARGLPRMSKVEIDETNKWLKDMLSRGWIRPSLASYAARFFFVPKPNGRGLRAVCDYRAINAVTKKILPSLPLFENVVTQLDGAKYFSALDLTSQFYQIRVEPEDVENTAFRTAVGCYEFLVTPMGTTPSVGTAMNTMQQVLQHCISLPEETLPENPRSKPPLPSQDDYPGPGEWKPNQETMDWQQYKYHSALGSYCALFVDDILLYSKTLEDHVRHLRQLCKTLRQHHLFLNPDKCHVCQVEVNYLGNLVGREGVRPQPDRTQALEEWPEPQNVTELKSFLGLLGFCRRYIPDLAQIAVPLNRLLKKGAPWQWEIAHQRAFDKLKRRCAAAPVLALPSEGAELVMRCDASREAMGVALYQRDNEGYLQPVEFKSKGFEASQQRLAAHDREALGLLFGLKSFRHFLLGREFQVQTDNSALSQILSSRDMSDLYSRWYWKIAEFPGMKLTHRAGRKLYCADALSRRKVVEGEDQEPFFVEPGQLFKAIGSSLSEQRQQAARLFKSEESSGPRLLNRQEGRVHAQLVQDEERHYVLKITNATEASKASTAVAVDEVCGDSAAFEKHEIDSQLLQTAKREWPSLYEQDKEFADMWKAKGDERWGYFEFQGLLWKNGATGPRLCVPAGANKVEILSIVHDSKLAAHGGRHRTLARAMRDYYWTGLYGDVVRYVETCHKCQVSKGERRARMGDPRALDIPQQPWQCVHLDWISGFEKSPEGYDAILVFIDSLTGMVHLQPCKKTDTAKDTARHFVHNVVRLHGMPVSVVSDRDVRLRAHFWRALQQRLGTELRFTTAHTPNSNGKVERMNMVLGDVLRSLCSFSGKNWADNLDLAEFAINGSENSATGMSPFFANYSRELRTPADVGKPAFQVPAADEFADAMFATVTHTRDALEKAKRKYEKQLNKKRRPTEKFKQGDKVLLSTRNLDLKLEARKLTSKFVGPFTVLAPPKDNTNPNVVWLETPRAFKIHMPVNLKDVKRYKERPVSLGGPNDEVPEPLLIDGHDSYEVEEILAERVHKRKRQVLVKWTGFNLLEATWEPLGNMPEGIIAEWREMQAKYSEPEFAAVEKLEISDSACCEDGGFRGQFQDMF